MPEVDLDPDGPHGPERTAEVADLLDQCSRFLTYATMAGKHGLAYPDDAYRLLGEVYSATGRFPQMCEQLAAFLGAQKSTGKLYEARGRDIADQVSRAANHLASAAVAADSLTKALQAVQADIAGLGVKDDPDA
jgi:hypothetical protein